MIHALRLLQLRRIRRQPGRALTSGIAVAAGVSLTISIVIISTSAAHSFRSFGNRLAGRATLRIVGAASRAGIDAGVLPAVEHTEGVAAAVPMVTAVTVSQRAGAKDLPVLVLGVDCRVEALIGRIGCDPGRLARANDSDPPLVSTDLLRHAGAGARLRTDQGVLSLAAAPTVGLPPRYRGDVAVFPLAVAQRLFDRVDRLDAIYVVAVHGADAGAMRARLTRGIGPWNGVVAADAPPPGARVPLITLLPLFAMLSVFALGIGAVLVYNTVTLSMEERRRQLAIVAAIGAPPATLLVGSMLEAGALGLAGGLVGTLGAYTLAHSIVKSLSSFTETFAGVPIRVHASVSALVAGAALGVVVGVGAAWLAARRALRFDVAAELGGRERRDEAAAPRVARRAGVFTAIGAVGIGLAELGQHRGGIEPWQPIAGIVGIVLGGLGFTMATGAWSPVVISAGRRLAERRGAVPTLAVANLVRDPRRTAVMAVAVGAAVGVAFTVASFNRAADASIRDGVLKGSGGRLRVSAVSPDDTINVDAALPPSVIDAIRRTPGVAEVDRSAGVLTGVRDTDLVGVLGFDHPTMPLALLLGSKDVTRFERGAVMIGPALARTRHLRPGSTMRLPTPTGYMHAPVLGIWQDGNFSGYSATVPIALLRNAWGAQPTRDVSVVPVRGVSTTALRARLLAAHLDPGLEVQTPAQLAAKVSADVTKQTAAFWALQRGLMLVAFVAVLSTLLLVGVQRRRELAMFVAAGMEPGRLARMVLLEAAIVGVVGSAMAIGAGIGMFEATRQTLPIFVGFHDPFRLDLGALAQYIPLTVAVILAAAVLPAWRTRRLDVVAALQYE